MYGSHEAVSHFSMVVLECFANCQLKRGYLDQGYLGISRGTYNGAGMTWKLSVRIQRSISGF